MRNRNLFLFVVLLLNSGAVSASAGPRPAIGGMTGEERNKPHPDLPREHDHGLFLRYFSGIGTGPDWSLGLDVGLIPTPGWASHVSISIRECPGASTDYGPGEESVIGLGITAFRSHGLVLSGSLGIAAGSFDAGPVAHLGLGKEWWVRDRKTIGFLTMVDVISPDEPDCGRYSIRLFFSRG